MPIVRRTINLDGPLDLTPEQEARLQHHRDIGDEGIDTSDIPELDPAHLAPVGEDRVLVPVDRQVVEWFQTRGGDYRERIGEVLKRFQERDPLNDWADGEGS